MSYFDSTVTIGYYHAFGSKYADHTFAMIEKAGERWAFPCFGMFATTEGYRGNKGVRYPVDFWSPHTLGSRNLGASLPANLHFALGMAQFTRTPRYNFRVSEWEAYWDRGFFDGIACNSGIVYAVTGVCQQICNRILMCTRIGDFDQSAVNWPPSFSASMWVYGWWGKLSEGEAFALANDLVRGQLARPVPLDLEMHADILEEPSVPPAGGGLAGVDAASLGAALRQAPDAAERREEIVEMVADAGGAPSLERGSALVGAEAADARFQALKRELDILLLRGEVAREEYAAKVNAAFRVLVAELRGLLSPEAFDRLFPEVVRVPGYELVNPRLMPADYAAARETAGL